MLVYDNDKIDNSVARSHFTQLICAGIPLSLKTLTLLKWKNEQGYVETFRLANRVCSKWQHFGTMLEQESNQLNSWAQKHSNDCLKIWKEVMDHWLAVEGTHDYPATWEGLYTLLEDLEFFKVAADLKSAISECAKMRE